MNRQNFNVIASLTCVFLMFAYSSNSNANLKNCYGRQINIVKKHAVEQDIIEFVEFLNVNYKDDFKVRPELDGLDFFASSLNKNVCDFGFSINLDNHNHLKIEHSLSRENCNKLTKKIVEDFQSQSNLPKLGFVEKICDGRI